MIQRDTLIKLINENKLVYVVNLELYATRSGALEALRQGDAIAELISEPRGGILELPAHRFVSLIN